MKQMHKKRSAILVQVDPTKTQMAQRPVVPAGAAELGFFAMAALQPQMEAHAPHVQLARLRMLQDLGFALLAQNHAQLAKHIPAMLLRESRHAQVCFVLLMFSDVI
jgi:hypothetical protein